jgi:DMSO/TMAO reductase YedYZ molybdopterin-dependent catalytic subunit
MRFGTTFFLSLVYAALAMGASAADPVLKIISAEKTLTFTAAEFAALPRTELKLPAQGDQEERRFAGVSMRELLARAGAPIGEKARSAGLMTAVIVHCKDNYSVLFSLAEFDENFSNRTILLADREDGEPLPPSAAPFRMVTPGDKRGARSCKQVTSIEIESLAKP